MTTDKVQFAGALVAGSISAVCIGAGLEMVIHPHIAAYLISAGIAVLIGWFVTITALRL